MLMILIFEFQDTRRGVEFSAERSNMSKSDKDSDSHPNIIEERVPNPDDLDQVPTFAFHENSYPQAGSSEPMELHEVPHTNEHDEVLMNDVNLGSPESRRKKLAEKYGGKGNTVRVFSRSPGFGQRSEDSSLQKVKFPFLLLNFFYYFSCALFLLFNTIGSCHKVATDGNSCKVELLPSGFLLSTHHAFHYLL